MAPTLKLVKTLWGIDEAISPTLFKAIASEGYSGVEVIALAYSTHDARAILIESANEAGLAVVCQIHTSGGYISDAGEYVYLSSYDVQDHKSHLTDQIATCSDLLKQITSGGFINVHAGVDAWTIEESMDFLKHVNNEAEKCSFKTVIETHRQRLFCSPFVTRELLQQMDKLNLKHILLNADLSHWVVSCERVFNPQEKRDAIWWPELLSNFASRCDYIHGRFGFAQGPQISDPSAKEYENDVKLQIKNWTEIWKSQISRNGKDCECWCSPELGPQPYMPALPHTQKDVASLPDAVQWTKEKIQEAFRMELSVLVSGGGRRKIF